MIHYIGKEWNTKFIISKTLCGIDWYKVDESTEHIEYTTCKKCLNKINKKIEKNKIQDEIENCLFEY
jgi:hypothetical protein